MTRNYDPEMLRPKDVVRFGSSKADYIVQWVQEENAGKAYTSNPKKLYVICGGPIGSPSFAGGRAFYVGPRGTSKIDPVTGKRRRVTPQAVHLVERPKE